MRGESRRATPAVPPVLESRQVGTLCGQEGSYLAVAGPSSPVPSLSPTGDGTSTAVCAGSFRSGSCRKDLLPSISGSSILCAQEKFHQETGHSRPVYSQPLNPMPILQNDDYFRCEVGFTSGEFCHLSRPQGRLLARSGQQILPQVPRFRHRFSEVSLQGHAFWPKYSSEAIQETMSADSQRVEETGDLCP